MKTRYYSSIPEVLLTEGTGEIRNKPYQVKNYKIEFEQDKYHSIYSASLSLDETLLRKQVKRIKNEIAKQQIIRQKFLKFNEKYQLVLDVSSRFMNGGQQYKDTLEILVLKILGFSDLIPLFLDQRIEEFYFSSHDLMIIVDHKEWGRCVYSKKISLQEMQTLIHHAEVEAEMILQPNHPSLKVAFQIGDIPIRIAIDGPPLSTKGFLVAIRKQKKKPFSLQELVKINGLTKEQAMKIEKIVKERKNIVIVGEPNSGKTTLAQAILMLMPKFWKIICIEDTSELSVEFYEQENVWAIEVPPFDSTNTFTDKKREILKLLHRSPDYVFIGEVQSEEHSNAMFEMLSAGLKGMQTIHSDSIENLIKRWVFQHDIALEQLYSLDYIIIMERKWRGNKIMRRVQRIIAVDTEMINDAIKRKRVLDYKVKMIEDKKEAMT